MANPLAAFQQGFGNALEQGQAVQQMGRRNALFDVYEQHGQGIAQGDPQALSALAGVDPMAAYDLRRQQAADRRAERKFDLGMEVDQARLEQIRQQTRLRAAEAAATIPDAEAAEELRRTSSALAAADAAYRQGDGAFAEFVMQNVQQLEAAGIDPNQITRQNYPVLRAGIVGASEALAERLGMEGPSGAEEPASIRALRVRAREAGLEPGTEAYQEFMRRGGSIPQGMAIEATPDGGMRFVQGEGVGGADGVEFTQQQSKDNVYATRARGALEAFEPVANAMADRGDRILELIPFGVGREAQGDDFQVAQQAGTEFLQAILRKDTGAAITQDEVESYGRVYLPRPGDSQAVLEAKRQARIRAINALESGMTPAQMLARDRALVAAAQESAEGRRSSETGEGPAAPSEQSQADGMTFEEFAQDPSAIAAAERYGVTLQEMWDIKQGMR